MGRGRGLHSCTLNYTWQCQKMKTEAHHKGTNWDIPASSHSFKSTENISFPTYTQNPFHVHCVRVLMAWDPQSRAIALSRILPCSHHCWIYCSTIYMLENPQKEVGFLFTSLSRDTNAVKEEMQFPIKWSDLPRIIRSSCGSHGSWCRTLTWNMEQNTVFASESYQLLIFQCCVLAKCTTRKIKIPVPYRKCEHNDGRRTYNLPVQKCVQSKHSIM